MRLRGLAVPALLAAVIVSLFVLDPASSSVGQWGAVRWGNLIVPVPPSTTGWEIVRLPDDPEHGIFYPGVQIKATAQMPLVLLNGWDGSIVAAVDAHDGRVVDVPVSSLPPIAREILDRVKVEPLDPATGPWPYSEDGSEGHRLSGGPISFRAPDPLSGIIYYGTTASGIGGAEMNFLTVSNGRSAVKIMAYDSTGKYSPGQVVEVRMDPGDREAFDRFKATIRIEP